LEVGFRTIDMEGPKNLKGERLIVTRLRLSTAPRALNDQGDIIEHCKMTVQPIGSLKSTTPPDCPTFALFEGIGNSKGVLEAITTDITQYIGLP
jgi:hypothetical protein